MSVFKKLKGTFQNAQQDIVEGLRALTTLDNHNRHERRISLKSRGINLDTGADLLQHYQMNWSSIQTETAESAKKAEEVATLMVPLFKVWEKHTQSLTQLEEEVKTIPAALTMLTQLQTLLDGLSESFIAAERELDILENFCDEQEYQKRCLEEQKKLVTYKVQKEAEAERIKVELALSHAKKMVELETAKKKNRQERVEAFTSAFQNDLDFYRTHGHPGRIPTEFPKVSSLSDIDLDPDKTALDSFLGPSGETESNTGSLELSGEGAYIEDDYTADFSVKQDMDFSVKQDMDFQEDNNYTSAAVISQLEIEDDNDDNSYAQNTVTSDLSYDSEDHTRKESTVETSIINTDNLSTSGSLQTTQGDVNGDVVERKPDENNDGTENLTTASQNTDVAGT